MLLLIILLINILLFLIFYLVLRNIFLKPSAIKRVDKYLKPVNEFKSIEKESSRNIDPRKILNSLGSSIGKFVKMKKYLNKNQELLIKAGIPLKAEELLSIQLILNIILLIFNYYLTKFFIVSFLMSLLGFLIPKIIINAIKAKRYRLFNEQLGDSITLISNSLKAGHSFLQAIDSVAKEMPEPISKEFEKVLKEIKLGVLTENALENLLKRIESEDLELMITAVLIQRQIGGNLSEILDNIANTIRERVKLKGEIKALTAQGRLSGIIVSLLPIAIGGILYLINTDYILTLFKSPYGIIMLISAIINEIFGIIMINKIVKIEV